MVGDRKIKIWRITFKALDCAFIFSDDENVVNGFFKRMIVISCCVAPREAIVVTDFFFGIFRCDIVCVAEPVSQKILYRFGIVIGIQIAYENGRALIFFAVFFDLIRKQGYLKFSCFIGACLQFRVSKCFGILGRFFPP